MKLTSLNSKEVKKIHAYLAEQYDFTEKLPYAFFIHETDNNLYCVDHDIDQLDLETLKINSLGFYFGEQSTDGAHYRLSIEGSQRVGPLAKKNVVTLTNDEFSLWMQGKDIPHSEEHTGYVLLKNQQGDFCGSGRMKNGVLLNFVPKSRRLKEVIPQ